MKKLLLLAVSALVSVAAFSQACTPDPQYTQAGVYPDSATGLPQACADQPYAVTITNIVPVDTVQMVGPVPITIPFDSVVIFSWTGLPTGFTYDCYDGGNTTSPVDQCAFEGGTSGCVLLSGNPPTADIGSYQQVITLDGYLGGQTTPLATEVVDYYYIHVVACQAGIETLSNSKFLVYPNPANEVITVNGLNDLDVERVSVVDMAGKVLRSYDNVDVPALDMDLTDVNSGMYFVQIDYNGTREMIKFIKK